MEIPNKPRSKPNFQALVLITLGVIMVVGIGYVNLKNITTKQNAAAVDSQSKSDTAMAVKIEPQAVLPKTSEFSDSTKNVILTPIAPKFDPTNPTGNYTCVTPPAGMVAWWPFDETSGTIAHDITPNHNDGNYVGSPLPTNGMVGKALFFSGTGNDYVRVPNSPSLNFGSGSFTIDMWIKPLEPSAKGVLLSKLGVLPGAGTAQGYLTSLYGPNLRNFTLVKGDNPTWVLFGGWDPPGNPPATPEMGKWSHIAITYTPNTNPGLFWYINGKNVYSVIPSYGYNGGGDTTFMNHGPAGSISNSSDLYIGKAINQVFNYFNPIPGEFRGGIDEVELFNRALTPREIANIYLAGPAGKCKSI